MDAQRVYFGNVSLARAVCPDCGIPALIVNGIRACCGAPVEAVRIIDAKKECDPRAFVKRSNHRISKTVKEKILRAQGYICAYCDVPFGAVLWDKWRCRKLRVEVRWDHFTPWAYAQSHKVEFIASCVTCNAIKSSKVFDTMAEARAFIQEARKGRFE